MDIKELFADLKVSDHARTAQFQTVNYLRKKGFDVHIEHRVPNRGDGKLGRIDIIAEKGEEILAIEFDRSNPRKKSLFKLENFDCDHRIVLLRGGKKNYKIGKVEVLSINKF